MLETGLEGLDKNFQGFWAVGSSKGIDRSFDELRLRLAMKLLETPLRMTHLRCGLRFRGDGNCKYNCRSFDYVTCKCASYFAQDDTFIC